MFFVYEKPVNYFSKSAIFGHIFWAQVGTSFHKCFLYTKINFEQDIVFFVYEKYQKRLKMAKIGLKTAIFDQKCFLYTKNLSDILNIFISI